MKISDRAFEHSKHVFEEGFKDHYKMSMGISKVIWARTVHFPCKIFSDLDARKTIVPLIQFDYCRPTGEIPSYISNVVYSQ